MPSGKPCALHCNGRLIAGWRQDWGVGDFPFFFVQLPNWNNDDDRSSNSWAFFREGQANVLKVPNTGIAVTIDIGDANNIHPKNKQEAGRRIALLALANTYHKIVNCHEPEFVRSEIHGAEVKIYLPGRNLFAKATADDPAKAIIQVREELENEIRKYKSKVVEFPRRKAKQDQNNS